MDEEAGTTKTLGHYEFDWVSYFSSESDRRGEENMLNGSGTVNDMSKDDLAPCLLLQSIHTHLHPLEWPSLKLEKLAGTQLKSVDED